ncbi:MAG: C25 family cysteine peptidase [Methanobacteriota archaeon]
MGHRIKNKLWISYIGIILLLSSTIIPLPSQSVPAIKEPDQQSQFEFHYTLPQLSQIEQATATGMIFLLYSFQNCQFLSEPGKPALPFTTSYIHIPVTAKNIQINVLSSSHHEERLEHHIYPAEKQVIQDDNGITSTYTEFFYDEEFYTNSESFYPSSQVEITEMGNIRGYRYLAVNIYPLQYQTKDYILRITDELSIQVTWDAEEMVNPQQLPKSFQNIINGLQMLNTNEQDHIDEGVREGQVQYPTDISDESNHAEYLIITADDFYLSPSLASIAHHRATFSGLNVAVVQTSDIYVAIGNTIPINTELLDPGDGIEGDLDLWIKTFIKYVYDFWDGGVQSLQYVLLVGDAYPNSTTFYLPFHTSLVIDGEGHPIATDYWYSCINNDYGNGFIDDFDSVADLIIGRFSVQNETELATVVNKTISYELFPPVNPEQEWGAKVLLTHSIGNPPLSNPMRQIRDEYIVPNHREVSEVYAEDYSDGQTTIDAMKSEINEGHGLFAHTGHGGAVDWQIDNGPRFGTNDVADLTNEERLPVILSMSCWTGMFDYTGRQSLAEVFVNTPGKGSIAFIGASRVSNSYYNTNLLKNILNAMFVNENLVLGSSIVEAKLGINNIGNNRLMYNLLGDPALNMSRTLVESDKPELHCSINSHRPENNTVVFNITVSNGGLGSANHVSVELFVNHPFEGGTLVEEGTRVINISAETNVSMNVALPVNETWDLQLFYLIVDRCDQIDELFENNSVSSSYLFWFVIVDVHGPYYGIVNSSVQFSGSAIGWFPPYNWTWFFYDGMILYGQNIERNYSTPGVKLVVLRVTDSRNHFGQGGTWVVVVDELIADAQGPYHGFIDEPVLFNGFASGGFSAYNFAWEFGDGTTANGQYQNHVYNHTGTYVVNLTVTDYYDYVSTNSTIAIIQERNTIVWVDDDFNESTPGYGDCRFNRISDAIVNVTVNGTIYVSNGTYYEHDIFIDRTVKLMGISRDNTSIDGCGEEFAVYIDYTDQVVVSGFTIKNSSMGILIHASTNTTISDNIIMNTDTGIYTQFLRNSIIKNNIITENENGCFLQDSSAYNTVSQNTLSYNNEGLILYHSWNNTIKENHITDNDVYGVFIFCAPWSESNDNVFYHNTFINNLFHAIDVCRNFWDNGYPSGGNYWSDYSGNDLLNGEDQNETGSDGIGDVEYEFEIDAVDRYPFMHENGWDIPRNPSPYHNQGQVNVHSDLSWTWTGFEPVTFDIYFGRTSIPTEKVSANQTATTYSPGHMMSITKYFWRVVAWDSAGRCVESPVWCFKTAYTYNIYDHAIEISR